VFYEEPGDEPEPVEKATEAEEEEPVREQRFDPTPRWLCVMQTNAGYGMAFVAADTAEQAGKQVIARSGGPHLALVHRAVVIPAVYDTGDLREDVTPWPPPYGGRR
jgi:hypothetical protein